MLQAVYCIEEEGAAWLIGGSPKKNLLQIARVAVYSLHKTSTRSHIQRIMKTEYSGSCNVLAELRYDLPASYAFHK